MYWLKRIGFFILTILLIILLVLLLRSDSPFSRFLGVCLIFVAWMLFIAIIESREERRARKPQYDKNYAFWINQILRNRRKDWIKISQHNRRRKNKRLWIFLKKCILKLNINRYGC